MGEQQVKGQKVSKSRMMNVLRRAAYIFLALCGAVTVFAAVILTPSNDTHTPLLLTGALLVLLSLILAAAVIYIEHATAVTEKLAHLRAQQHRTLDHDQLQTILNSISVGIIGVTTSGTIRTYNAAFLSLLDTNENLTGRKISEILPLTCCETEEPLDIMSYVEKGTLVRHDNAVLKYDEDDAIRLGILVNTIRESGDEPAGYIFIVEDITKEKTLEEERDEFISVVSHELRTPVTVSEGSISNAQLLLDRGADASMLRDAFKDAHDQIVFLAGMINDLSTLSRAERGVGDAVEAIVVDDLANDLYAKYSSVALEKGLQFNLDVAGRIGRVTTSSLYLEEILQNFITNAIKYTQKGKVTLEIRRTDEGVRFAVTDTGIGISVTDQKKIFEKFYRSEDYRTRETSGTGLGLYVVRKLAKKLGITIKVDSRLNRGSTFYFVLPYGK
jgi:PAS domain S-box-containing protein